ncbi:hypothetical protein V8G54_026008 [Vigna mungo]|uniref:Retrotransposon gag domain-containing protein n=1 Tax=Vigna mungo TaxID=3915 RepID=A0AAQ3MZD4_VIGMU
MKKILLPPFYGEDPVGWIAKVEVYFNVNETREAVRVNLAQLCMEGNTIHFFHALLNEYDELTWEDLKREMLERYGGRGEGSATNAREQYFSYFTQGLKNKIRARIRSLHMAHPLSRGRMMNVARAIDVEILRRNKIWQGRGEFRGDRSQGLRVVMVNEEIQVECEGDEDENEERDDEDEVRITEDASLYALCRSWLRNGVIEESQPQQKDVIKALPKPLPAYMVAGYISNTKEDEKNEDEQEENEQSVENLSPQDLLKRHIKRAKKVKLRLREERLHRITKYRSRLRLLLPATEQCRSDTAAGN